MHQNSIARIVYFTQRRCYSQPHSVCQINFHFLKLWIWLEYRTLKTIFVVEYYIITVHYVDITIIIYRHTPQLLDYEIEINLYANDANKLLFNEERCHIRNNIGVCGRINIRFNPSCASTPKWNIVPTDVLLIVGRIKRKIGNFSFYKLGKCTFPAYIFACHEKAALRSAQFWCQVQIVSNGTVRSSCNIVEAFLHIGEIFFSIGGIVPQSFIAVNGINRLAFHSIYRLPHTKEGTIQPLSTDNTHCVKRIINV